MVVGFVPSSPRTTNDMSPGVLRSSLVFNASAFIASQPIANITPWRSSRIGQCSVMCRGAQQPTLRAVAWKRFLSVPLASHTGRLRSEEVAREITAWSPTPARPVRIRYQRLRHACSRTFGAQAVIPLCCTAQAPIGPQSRRRGALGFGRIRRTISGCAVTPLAAMRVPYP